jgi:hypothetical protein
MSKSNQRLKRIYQLILDIEFIISNNELKLTHAIENKVVKPAIRMNIVRIAEQFAKLKDDNEFKVLEHFSSID